MTSIRSRSGLRDRVEHVRGADEERVREVVRDLEIAVDEGVVLLRIEHFEQRRRRIAAEVFPDLVDLVDHDQRVVHADLDVALDQLSRHRADVGLAMPADLRLVGDAADRHAHELPSERVGDRGAERGFADAGRSDEAEDRSFEIALQLQHGQKLEHALFDFLEPVVPLFEDLLGAHEIELVLGLLRPRHLKDRVEMAFDDGVVATMTARAAPRRFTSRRSCCFVLLGERKRLDAVAIGVGFALGGVRIAQLVLDDAQLLAQIVLALAAIDRGLDLALQLAGRRWPCRGRAGSSR